MTPDGAILITGASSGIGRALATSLARPGVALHLAGRDATRLAAAAALCAARGATVATRILDVTDAAAAEEWVRGAGRLALVIANAGIGGGIDGGGPEPTNQVRAILAANLDGALNVMLPALSVMAAQTPGPDGVRGRIAAVASIAAFVAAPGAPSYCASKAALDAYTVATAPAAARLGIHLSSVCPGYVRTALTARNRFPMPGLMDADRAAAIILRGIARGRRRIAFPWWMALAARLAGLLPAQWSGAALALPAGKAPLPARDAGVDGERTQAGGVRADGKSGLLSPADRRPDGHGAQ